MKIKLIIFLLALALVASMIIPGPDGKPVMTLDDWKSDTSAVTTITSKAKQLVNSASQVIVENTGMEPNRPSKKLHKWKDAQGNWHFSDKATDDEMATDKTIEEIPDLKNDTIASDIEVIEKPQASGIPSLTTPPLGKISELKSDAEKIKQLAQKRVNTLESM